MIWPGVSGSPPLLAPRRLTPRGVPPIPQPPAVQNIGNLPAGLRQLCASVPRPQLRLSSRMATVSSANPQASSTPPSSPGGQRRVCERHRRPCLRRFPTSYRQLCEPFAPTVPASHRQLRESPPLDTAPSSGAAPPTRNSEATCVTDAQSGCHGIPQTARMAGIRNQYTSAQDSISLLAEKT